MSQNNARQQEVDDLLQQAEDNAQQYLRQQMRGQLNQRRVDDLAPAFDMRQERYADYFADALGSEHPSIRGTAQRVLDKNTQDMIDYYNYLQFEQEPQNLLDRRATEQAVYTGSVPFGYEDSDYLGVRGRSGVLGTSLKPEVADEAGIPRQVYVAGNNAAFSQVPIHEGMHPIIDLPKNAEENALRSLDYYRLRRQGADTEQAEDLLRQRGMDINDPQELGYVRFNALRGAMSMTDEVYDSLSEEEREEMRAQVQQFEQQPGFIGKLFGEEKGVKEMMFAPYHLEEMSEDEFYKLLDAAPAFQFNEAESYRGRGRLYMNPRTAVQNYEFGGVAKPDPDRLDYAAELLSNTSPETFFSDAREAFKMNRVEGREYGDLLPFVSRERVDRGPEGIDTTYYFDPRAGGIADTVMDKLLQLGEKATEYFYPDADAKVQNYQNGGPVGPPEDPQGDMFPEAIREGLGTLVEYAPKMAKFAARGAGDLFRSDPVSPPEFAVDRPTELTEFQMDTEILKPEELDRISDTVIGKLYEDEIVNRLEDPEERAGLFLYADKPGVENPPPKSALLRDTVRGSLEQQKQMFDKMKAEGQVGIREGAPILSRSTVMQNVFNVLREQIGPQAMARIGDDRLLNLVERSVRESSVERFAAGGVVSLKDRAVNMNRGPRTNGIMDYVPYITGATYGN